MTNRTFRADRRGITFTAAAAAAILAVGGPAGRAPHSPRGRPARAGYRRGGGLRPRLRDSGHGVMPVPASPGMGR
jgi:hypothetical protein